MVFCMSKILRYLKTINFYLMQMLFILHAKHRRYLHL